MKTYHDPSLTVNEDLTLDPLSVTLLVTFKLFWNLNVKLGIIYCLGNKTK